MPGVAFGLLRPIVWASRAPSADRVWGVPWGSGLRDGGRCFAAVNGYFLTQQGVWKIMGKLNIRPLNDKVIVKRLDAEEKTAGGIVLPDSAQEKPKRGVIKAVGNGRMLDTGERSTMQVKRNQEVLFTSYAGTEVKVGGDEYLIMDESDILGVIE